MRTRMKLSEVKLTKRSIENANLVTEWLLLFGKGWVKWDVICKAGFVNQMDIESKWNKLHRARLCTDYNHVNESVRIKAIGIKYANRIRRLQKREKLI